MRSIGILFVLLIGLTFVAAGQSRSCDTVAKYENHNQVEPMTKVLTSLKGVVRDRDGVGIPNACVQVYRDRHLVRSQKTDGNGRFNMPEVRHGQYTVVVSYSPFCTANTPITIRRSHNKYRHRLVFHMELAGTDSCSHSS
ncbi:MAG TPA: carboxypeptidase-like regulatory domain-containing protein [Pyrinomonadaceae bacterium]|nr:carboxypeptidase-like regulatory domain-containing protein [Pyrinomonadaceae bacterium]